MKKNEQKPKIRFKGFTDAWEQRKFGECVLIQRGGSPRPIESYLTTDNINGINWIKIGDVKAGERYITKTAEKIIPEGVKNSREVFPGDLILSNSMSFGRPYIMGVYGCIHDGWLVIKDTNNLFDKEYLLQLLSSEYMYNQYRQLASGGVVNNLNSELVQNTNILLTNMEEQKKLGLIFKSIDNLITLHQRKCDKLVNIKKSLLEKMFPKNGNNVPEIRFKGFTEAWEQHKLNEFCEYTTSNLTAEDIDENGKFDLYDANGRIGRTNKNVQKEKYITIIKDGSGVGRTRLTPQNSAFIGTMGALHNKNSDINFLYCCLQNTNFSKEITGATIPHIYFSNYGENNYMIPKIKEQQRIGNIFKELDTLITLHQRKLEQLKNVKKSLIEKMFV